MTAALDAAAARGIRVQPLPRPDEWGNTWEAVIPRRGRGPHALPQACMRAATDEEAARAALQYIGANGWAR